MMPHRQGTQGTRDTVMMALRDSTTTTLSVRLTALTAREPSRTFLSVLLAGSCWLLLIATLHSRQHTMLPGNPAASFFPRPSLLFSRFGVLQLLPPRGQRWQTWTLRPIHALIRTHACTYSIGQDCIIRPHAISGPTLAYAPRDAAEQAADEPRWSAYQPAGPV